MPHNFVRGFIIITFLYAKNILAKVSRVLSMDNLVLSYGGSIFHLKYKMQLLNSNSNQQLNLSTTRTDN